MQTNGNKIFSAFCPLSRRAIFSMRLCHSRQFEFTAAAPDLIAVFCGGETLIVDFVVIAGLFLIIRGTLP
jgi:hypothetical protein